MRTLKELDTTLNAPSFGDSNGRNGQFQLRYITVASLE